MSKYIIYEIILLSLSLFSFNFTACLTIGIWGYSYFCVTGGARTDQWVGSWKIGILVKVTDLPIQEKNDGLDTYGLLCWHFI